MRRQRREYQIVLPTSKASKKRIAEAEEQRERLNPATEQYKITHTIPAVSNRDTFIWQDSKGGKV
jgi:hypothetical protein